MTNVAAQPVSSPAGQGAPARTLAQRVLRSLNSLSVVVADSTRTARDL